MVNILFNHHNNNNNRYTNNNNNLLLLIVLVLLSSPSNDESSLTRDVGFCPFYCPSTSVVRAQVQSIIRSDITHLRDRNLNRKFGSISSDNNINNNINNKMLFHDGPSLEARFNKPNGICTAPDGKDVYVADTFNHRIRRIDVQFGTVTTLAGTNEAGHEDGVANKGQAKFKFPEGCAVSPDGGFVYVADAMNNKIRVIILGSGIVRTVAGSGLVGYHDDVDGKKARFNKPTGIVMHPDGHTLFVSDTANNMIRKIDVKTGEVSTLIGQTVPGLRDGDTLQAHLFSPRGLSCSTNDKCQFLAVADSGNHAIRLINTANGQIKTISGGNGRGYSRGVSAREAQFSKPTGVSFLPSSSSSLDKNVKTLNVLIVDSGNGAIRKVPLTVAEINKWQKDVTYEFKLERDSVSDVTIVDQSHHVRDQLNRRSATKASFETPFGISVCPESKRVYVTDRGNPASIKLLDIDRKLARTVAGALNVEFDHTQNENGDSILDDEGGSAGNDEIDDGNGKQAIKHITGIYDVRHRGGISSNADKDSLHPNVILAAKSAEAHSAEAVWARGVETNLGQMGHENFYHYHTMSGTFGSMMDKYEEAKMRAKNTSAGKRFIRWWISLSLFMQVFYYLLFQVVWYIGLKYVCKKSPTLNAFVEWSCEKSGYNRFMAWFYLKSKPLRDLLSPIFDHVYRRVIVRLMNVIVPKLKRLYESYPIIDKTLEFTKTSVVSFVQFIKSSISISIFSKLIPFIQKWKIILFLNVRRVSPKFGAIVHRVPKIFKEFVRFLKVLFQRMRSMFKTIYGKYYSNSSTRTATTTATTTLSSTRKQGAFQFSSATTTAMKKHPPSTLPSEFVEILREQRVDYNSNKRL